MTPILRKRAGFWMAAIWMVLGNAAARADSAADWRLESGSEPAALLELYSSEGCSSCPYADSWVSGLRSSPDLWKRFVPVVFHVDYWNSRLPVVGWVDAYSQRRFADRQRTYARGWGSDSVYTPEFILNGREWTRAMGDPAFAPGSAPRARLRVTRAAEGDYRITVEPSSTPGRGTHARRWEAHAALLGNGLVTQVKGGENSGRTLRHDFAALDLRSAPLKPAQIGGALEARIRFDAPKTPARPASLSLAVWITEAGQQTPLQAVGGDLPQAAPMADASASWLTDEALFGQVRVCLNEHACPNPRKRR